MKESFSTDTLRSLAQFRVATTTETGPIRKWADAEFERLIESSPGSSREIRARVAEICRNLQALDNEGHRIASENKVRQREKEEQVFEDQQNQRNFL